MEVIKSLEKAYMFKSVVNPEDDLDGNFEFLVEA
jgi:hypothetical protein